MATPRHDQPGDESVIWGWPAALGTPLVRRLAIAAYLLVLVVSCTVVGVPIDRMGISLWILAGLSVLCIGRGWRTWRLTMLTWIPFEAVLLAYDYSYGYAGRFNGSTDVFGYPLEGATNSLGLPLHTTFPIEADRLLFGGVVPGQWLQQVLHTNGPIAWVSVPVTLTYLSHFFVTPAVAVGLWIWARPRFLSWARAVISVAVVGLATYLLFPMAPPWLASQQDYLSGSLVERLNGEGFRFMNLRIAADVLADGQARSNPVAAMPSLHMAYATLVVLFFWGSARWWLRALLVCYPLLMAFTLLYAGEHYVIDELAGVALAVVVTVGWRRFDRWRSGREGPDREALLGAGERPGAVADRARRDAEPVGTERHRGVEADPGTARLP